MALDERRLNARFSAGPSSMPYVGATTHISNLEKRTMKYTLLSKSALALAACMIASQAQAGGRIEKVDAVREGIDLKQIVVNANGAGYTSTATQNHQFMIRVYAKAKGKDGVYWAGVGPYAGSAVEVGRPYLFEQWAGSSDGWTVYKKSLTLNGAVNKTYWYETPVNACKANLDKQVKNGKARADVMKREWKVTARARLVFSVTVDDRSNNRHNKHKVNQVASGHKDIVYPVPVLCKKGL
jgi:hypothetical protein